MSLRKQVFDKKVVEKYLKTATSNPINGEDMNHVLEANKQLINELEWRLNVQVKEEV